MKYLDPKEEKLLYDKNWGRISSENKLIENGAHSMTKVVYSEDYGIIDRIQDFWFDDYYENQSNDITIKNFILWQDSYNAGGSSKSNSRKAKIYCGLNSSGENEKSKAIPLFKYVNAALHEIGHGTYGFKHDSKGNTESGEGIMDYDHTYDEDAKFDTGQQSEIKSRANENHALQAESREKINPE